jgi:4-alpha-glucanotransferase
MAAMFDAFRIDHLVGFYRTYWRPANGDTPFFVPAHEADQRRLGEAVIEAFASAGAALIAEDLGTIPDFVRASLESLRLPGYKVLRWERDWHVKGQPFHDPATYAAASLATTGTHDTDMLADWWDTAPLDERTALLALPALQGSGLTATQPFDDHLRDALLEVLMRSGSDLVVFPLQDLFGWRDRINVPATVEPTNWSWASPIPVDRLLDDPVARARAETLASMVTASRRGGERS